MKKIKYVETINLNNALAPNAFALSEGKVIYFEQVNKNEGFFKILIGERDTVIFETNDIQGEICRDGELFGFEIRGLSTVINHYSHDGECTCITKLNGVYFELQRDDGGELLCLGTFQSKTRIIRIGKENKVMNCFSLDNIIFGSTIYLNGGFIYLGVVDLNNKLSILRLNSKGETQITWPLNIDSIDRFISKIIIYYNYIFTLVDGKKKSIVIINRVDGAVREIELKQLGFHNMMDFNIYENKIYILNESCIYILECEELLSRESKGNFHKKERNPINLYYGYYIFSKGVREKITAGFLYSFLPTAVIYFVNRLYGRVGLYDSLSLIISLYVIVSYFVTTFMGVFSIAIKEQRIEYLLCINEKESTRSSIILALYFALSFYSVITIAMFPGYNLLVPLLSLVLSFSLIYFINRRCFEKIHNINNNMVVELLEDKNNTTYNYVKTTLNTLDNVKKDKLYISIVLNKKINKKLINKWNASRKYILGKEAEIEFYEHKITTRMDLTKRNIKYSRISIIMDYICFLKSFGEIVEIRIDSCN